MTHVADYIAERVRRAVPVGCSVIQGSTPVVSFGNVETSWVATLGLNPSLQEFADSNGNWLAGDSRRLATSDSLGIEALERASDRQIAEVVAECYGYFQRNPYWWFNGLETLMGTAAGSSYFDGTACHLDLVQWATNPVWNRLEPLGRRRLIAEDREFLRQQLQWERLRLVLLNGITVINQVRAMGIPLAERQPAVVGGKTCKIFVGSAHGATFIGWSKNLQSSFGMSHDFKRAIAERVRDEVAEAGVKPPVGKGDSAHHPERGTTVHSTAELADLFASWLKVSTAKTLGDVGLFGGKAWIAMQLNGHKVVVNSDTKREAVKAYLEHVETAGMDAPWHVIANAKGKVNKVVYTTDADLPGWYSYTTKPWQESGKLL